MTVKRVPLQAATSALSALKLFADSNGDVISHSGIKVGSFTKDTADASGNQAITGVGFKPSAVIFFAAIGGTLESSWGMDDGTSSDHIAYYSPGTYYALSNYYSIVLYQTASIYYRGVIASFDSDGFTVNWEKTGAKTGTARLNYLAFR